MKRSYFPVVLSHQCCLWWRPLEKKWFRQHWVGFGGVSIRTKRVLPTFFLLKFVVCSGVSIGTKLFLIKGLLFVVVSL